MCRAPKAFFDLKCFSTFNFLFMALGYIWLQYLVLFAKTGYGAIWALYGNWYLWGTTIYLLSGFIASWAGLWESLLLVLMIKDDNFLLYKYVERFKRMGQKSVIIDLFPHLMETLALS